MPYAAAAAAALLSAAAAYLTLNGEIADRLRIFARADDPPGRQIGARAALLAAAAVFAVSFFAALRIVTDVTDPLNLAKMLSALVLLAGSAGFDFRKERIPNIFPLVMFILGAGLVAAGILTGQDGAMSYMLSSGFAACVCAVGLSVCSLLSHKGIGMGDIKLLTALGMLCGATVIAGTIFFGVLACAIVSVILLILKKKDLHGTLPFGPFIWFGFILTMLISAY